MNPAPVIPDSAPFSLEQRMWLNGYLAGLFARKDAPLEAPPQKLIPLTILFGSQTGTAETLAKQVAKAAIAKQFVATIVDMAQATAETFLNAKHLLVITSTYGDGEPPDNARDLWDALAAENFPVLPAIPYSVFALGDTSYEQFCKFGKDIDERLAALGAKRIYERSDADTDYEQAFQTWCSGAIGALSSVAGEGGFSVTAQNATVVSTIVTESDDKKYSKKKPYWAKLVENRLLSLAGSEKEVRHFTIGLDASITYEPGDALGVIPQNNPAVVDKILKAHGFGDDTLIEIGEGQTLSIRQALIEIYDLKKLPENTKSAHEFVAALKKIQPRLYSISSSPRAHRDKVQLTVSIVRYASNNHISEGLCSAFLADRAITAALPIYVHTNTSFRLPTDLTTPIIMVGPGTGIAPFRAFLEERREAAASGKNVLFFGEQRANTDFYYREELEQMVNDGFLTLHTAFSRDQAEKIYVQQRMIENAQQIYALLEQGAYFYVCGDAARMAKDVDAALHRIIEGAARFDQEAAKDYVQKLRSTKRYVRDVY